VRFYRQLTVSRILQDLENWLLFRRSGSDLHKRVGHYSSIGVASEAQGAMPPKYLAYLVILCFVRRRRTQNTVACLLSKILHPKKIWAGYAIVSLFSPQTNKLFIENFLDF